MSPWTSTFRRFGNGQVVTLDHSPRLIFTACSTARSLRSQLCEDHYPWVRQEILAGRLVAHRSLQEMPAEAAKDRQAALQLGIKSHLTLPLAVGGEKPLGVLGFNTMRAERAWPEALVKRLQMVAQIFANALARKRADTSAEFSRLIREKRPGFSPPPGPAQ